MGPRREDEGGTSGPEESWSPAVALAGRENLGLGRHWHFLGVPFWVLTGAVYVLLIVLARVGIMLAGGSRWSPASGPIGQGQGAWREDRLFYASETGI